MHLIRQSLRYVPRRQYDQVVKDMRPIYTAVDADAALAALETFEEKWGEKLPVIGQAWRNSWEYITPFLAFEPEVRPVVYTTNAIEALNRASEDFAARRMDRAIAGALTGKRVDEVRK